MERPPGPGRSVRDYQRRDETVAVKIVGIGKIYAPDERSGKESASFALKNLRHPENDVLEKLKWAEVMDEK